MRLFICGDQESEFIEGTLNYLHENHNITEICGSATSRCMDTVAPWCEDNGVHITLYLPEEFSIPGMIAQNKQIITKEHPFAVLIYAENPEVVDSLIMDAANSSSVHYVIKENS